MMKYTTFLLPLLMLGAFCRGAEKENLLKNPAILSSEPGAYPHWKKIIGSCTAADGVTTFIPDAKKNNFIFLQILTPAPETDYLLCCEVRSASAANQLRVYGELTRKDENGKLRYTTFTLPRKTAPSQWLKTAIPIRLEPGWKDFYVAVKGTGKGNAIRNLRLIQVPSGVLGNLLKNADMAAGDQFSVLNWHHVSGTVESADGTAVLTPVKGKALLFQKLAVKQNTDYLLSCEISYSGTGRARIYAEGTFKGPNGKIAYKTFTAPGIKAPFTWKKISIPVRLTTPPKDFYVAAAVNGGGVMKIRALSFVPIQK